MTVECVIGEDNGLLIDTLCICIQKYINSEECNDYV